MQPFIPFQNGSEWEKRYCDFFYLNFDNLSIYLQIVLNVKSHLVKTKDKKHHLTK